MLDATGQRHITMGCGVTYARGGRQGKAIGFFTSRHDVLVKWQNGAVVLVPADLLVAVHGVAAAPYHAVLSDVGDY